MTPEVEADPMRRRVCMRQDHRRVDAAPGAGGQGDATVYPQERLA